MRRSFGSPLKSLVSVLTPSIPERTHLLAECRNSVFYQTFDRWEHLVEVDEEGEGCSVVMNRLAAAAKGEWLLALADDDLLLPGCLDALIHASHAGDVIYAPPLVTGNEDRWWFYQEPPVIPSFGLIRKELWDSIGGYDEALTREEDRNFWVAALDAGARFVRVDYPCWVYRQHTGNKSFAATA